MTNNNNDYLDDGEFRHAGDAFADQFDDIILGHAREVGMDPDHEYWDEWYDAEWVLAFTAYMSEILPNVSLTITATANDDRFEPWTIITNPPK